ncbi:glycoside hydrolase superfamily [Daedaleopsis nitida]|nr:glycoside hydrolase superfamily [Daedaleopsis nitida]
MRFLLATTLLAASLARKASAAMPDKIYGVNLGSWLLLEPWMLPEEWASMGGENDCPCGECISSEFALAQAYPDSVDERFEKHWSSWFNQTDVDTLVAAGINTVRIPLGYWILERLVDRKTEFYPRGGIYHLQRGLKALKKAGISVILDHHALPGVQAVNQQFAGRCTDDVQFYTPYNYQRALVWTAVMTAISHLDPDFESVSSIQAVNEPIMDASQTPGYGDFQKNYVQTIRAVEYTLGIGKPSLDLDFDFDLQLSLPNVTAAISATATGSGLLNFEVQKALLSSIPIIVDLSHKLNFKLDFKAASSKQKHPLVANFMDVGWQWGDRTNPADAAIGPMGYDNHLYYSFGSVADANELAYMISICNLNRVEDDAAMGNTPLWFGEWALPTEFNASDEFLYKWGDAQKLAYSKSRGWIFWNFKVEETSVYNRQWSYFEALKRGYMTQDPSKYNDPDVCAPYVGQIYTPIPASTSTTESTSTTDNVSATTTEVTVTTNVPASSASASTSDSTSTLSSTTLIPTSESTPTATLTSTVPTSDSIGVSTAAAASTA